MPELRAAKQARGYEVLVVWDTARDRSFDAGDHAF
jgi:hypothetical protein